MQPTFFDETDFYQPRRVDCFTPSRIIWAKGCERHATHYELLVKIAELYPDAKVENQTETAHNRVFVSEGDLLKQHTDGKQTLVFSEHRSAVQFSKESGNTCPNYWHFSLYGFCPYGCSYCYLAGTPGVKFSPTVKIFLNLDGMVRSMPEMRA